MNDIAARKPAATLQRITPLKRPTRAEAEAAVRTLIAWAGDERLRLGLTDGLDAPVHPRWPLEEGVRRTMQ